MIVGRRRSGDRLGALLVLPLAVMVLMVVGVVVALVLRLTPAELWAALSSAETLTSLRLSLWTSLAALAVALVLAVPAAYLMARREFPGRLVLDTLLDIPLVMPPLVAGLGLLFLFGHRMLGEPLAMLGLSLLFSPLGVVLAQSFIAATVLLRTAKAAFESVDPGYGAVAATLGLPPWQVFWRINLPLAARGIASGAVLAWARALGEFGATLMVAGANRPQTETLPMAVYLNIATGETGVAVACALILLVVAFGLLLGMRALGGAQRRRA